MHIARNWVGERTRYFSGYRPACQSPKHGAFTASSNPPLIMVLYRDLANSRATTGWFIKTEAPKPPQCRNELGR